MYKFHHFSANTYLYKTYLQGLTVFDGIELNGTRFPKGRGDTESNLILGGACKIKQLQKKQRQLEIFSKKAYL